MYILSSCHFHPYRLSALHRQNEEFGRHTREVVWCHFLYLWDSRKRSSRPLGFPWDIPYRWDIFLRRSSLSVINHDTLLGGIVTFTPSAFTSYDPLSVLQLIGQIAEHPLWACYILPSVLGKVASVSHGDDLDPLSSYDK